MILHIKYTHLICMAVLFLTDVGLPAETTGVRTLTPADAINIALNKSYAIQSSLLHRTARQYYYDYTRAMFKPRLDFHLNAPAWNEQVSAIEQSNGLPVYNSVGMLQYGGQLAFRYTLPTGGYLGLSSQVYRENLQRYLALQDYKLLETNQARTSLSLQFSQPIFTPNTLKLNLHQAQYEYQISSSQFTRDQMDIIYQVTNEFYQLYKASRLVEIARERLTNAREVYRIARLKGQSGRIPEAEVLIAELAELQAEGQLSEARGSLGQQEDALKLLIGIPLEEEIRVVTKLEYDTFAVDLQKAIEEASQHRLDLYEGQQRILLREIDLKKARSVREFKGSINAYYDLTGVSTFQGADTPALFYSSVDNFLERPPNRGINLSFSFPISDWGRGAAQVRQAEANLKEAQLSQQYLRAQISKEVREVVRRVRESRRRLGINKKAAALADSSYRINLMRFESGNITSQELGREQERLSAAQLDYLNAYIDYQLAVADLERKTMWDFKEQRSYLKTGYFSNGPETVQDGN